MRFAPTESETRVLTALFRRGGGLKRHRGLFSLSVLNDAVAMDCRNRSMCSVHQQHQKPLIYVVI